MDRLCQNVKEIKLESEIRDGIIPREVLNFSSEGKGGWNEEGWYGNTASANVLLIHKLCLATLDSYKSQLTLEMLKDHYFVEICSAIQIGEYNLQQFAKTIRDRLEKICYPETEEEGKVHVH